ncbi:MAG: glycosyltransferase family 2 protein [Desulfobacterales bacterium]|mgnify:FL=1|jgi:glycosyltransferase involved in cell wall biosynthesis|nr:glycosyltransferase family 2 protein [Desulfobacterales bacterium]
MGTSKIGVAVIAMNEADRIGRLLDSVKFADEIVVVDSGSTDGTQALCKKAGAKVIYREWDGYAAQKQSAMECISSEWILNLDADEEVSENLAEEIRRKVKQADPDIHGFSMPRLSRYLGRWIRHGGWYPDRKLRIVRKGKGMWKGDALHEQLLVEGGVETLSNPLFHHVYREISDQVVTINKFSDVYAAEKGPREGWFVFVGIIHATGKFLECYFWKLGMLDGIAGAVIAMNSAWYIFLKHAKMWELSSGEKDSTGD